MLNKKELAMSDQQKTDINNIIISDRSVLNHIWPNVLAKYWQRFDEGFTDRNLYDIFTKDLKVKNVQKVYIDENNKIYQPYKISGIYKDHQDLESGIVEINKDGNVIKLSIVNNKNKSGMLIDNKKTICLDKTAVHILSEDKKSVLVTLRAIDNDIKFATENVETPVNGYADIFGNLTIKIPPQESVLNAFKKCHKSQANIVANYHLLGFYFPLEQVFNSYGSKTATVSTIEMVRDDEIAEKKKDNIAEKKKDDITEKKEQIAEKIIQQLSSKIVTWFNNTYDEKSTDKFVDQLRKSLLKQKITQHKKAAEQTNNVGELFDRGGSFALIEDDNWKHFVPRMLAYNWYHPWHTAVARFWESLNGEQTFNKVQNGLKTTNTDAEEKAMITGVTEILTNAGLKCIITNNLKNEIAQGDLLSSYPQMLETLDFSIPKGLKIFIEYADSLPFDGNDWHPDDYASELDVILPAPPKMTSIDPSAIADFSALRASQPFTVG